MSALTFEAIQAAFPEGKRRGTEFVTFCPVHNDINNPNLCISIEGNKLLTHCNAGCAQKDVFAAVTSRLPKSSPIPIRQDVPAGWNYSEAQLEKDEAGLSQAAAFLESRGISMDTAAHLRFGFEDGRLVMPTFADGKLVAAKFRATEPSNPAAKWRKWTGDKGIYHLFNSTDAAFAGDLYITESELDCAMLVSLGIAAVSVDSANHILTRGDEELLAGAGCVILALDSDAAGQKCAARFEQTLAAAKPVRILPPTGFKDLGELYADSPKEFPARLAALTKDALTPWVSRRIPLIGNLSPKPVTWLIPKLQPETGLGMIASKQGGQKSMTALVMAGAIAQGGTFLGRKVSRACPVLYVDRENPEAVVSERATKLGITSDNLRYWGDWHAERTPEPDDPRLLEFAANGGFIIFDSLQDWYGDANENDNSAMVQLMNKFKHLARIGAGVLLLHHQDKFGKASYRGCSSIVGLTDMAFASQKTDAGVIQIREERFRMCGGWEIDFRFHFGDTYTLEVLRDESVSDAIANQQAEADNARTAKHADQVAAVAAAIRKNPAASILAISTEAHVSRNRGTVDELAKEAGFQRNAKKVWVESGALMDCLS